MWKNATIVLSIIICFGLIWGILSSNNDQLNVQTDFVPVREENGTQYIHILARGGYFPRQIKAKANMSTMLEIETKGTYDCSAALTIPKLGYQKFLPGTGITNIEIPKNVAINSLDILCSMGMYHTTINFNS